MEDCKQRMMCDTENHNFGELMIFSERELTICHHPSVGRLSVTFVHPTQAIEIFGNISTPSGTLASVDIQVKFYGDRPGRTPPSGE